MFRKKKGTYVRAKRGSGMTRSREEAERLVSDSSRVAFFIITERKAG